MGGVSNLKCSLYKESLTILMHFVSLESIARDRGINDDFETVAQRV